MVKAYNLSLTLDSFQGLYILFYYFFSFFFVVVVVVVLFGRSQNNFNLEFPYKKRKKGESAQERSAHVVFFVVVPIGLGIFFSRNIPSI
jgi:hypothetical protein